MEKEPVYKFAVNIDIIWHEFPELINKPVGEFIEKFLNAVDVVEVGEKYDKALKIKRD